MTNNVIHKLFKIHLNGGDQTFQKDSQKIRIFDNLRLFVSFQTQQNIFLLLHIYGDMCNTW